MERSLMKPLITGATAGLIERFYLDERNMNLNLMFASAVAIGSYGSEFVIPLVGKLPHMPTISESLYDGKTLAQRIVEVSTTSALGYAIAKYVFKSEKYTDELYTKLAIVAVSDVVGEYACDYLENKPMDYLGAK